MPVDFARGPASQAPFEAGLLPLAQKEDLCRSLLAEFGATSIRERVSDHELIHGCLIDPTHRDQARNPTASLNYEKLTYRCLGCGARGGLLWFIATCRGGSSQEAGRWLAQTVGTDGQVMELADLMRYLDAVYANRKARPTIPTYSERMLAPWSLIHPYLTDPVSQGGRGIPESTVRALRLGYASDYKIGERADKSPITSERIVLPHFWKGDLVGWQTRRLDARDGTAKYLSSPDFPKDSTLYNYDPRATTAVVVESMMSVAAHLHALPQMEATFGASVTDTQVRLLAKHPTVVLFFDNDKAGWSATEQVGAELARSATVFVVDNPFAADPGDMTTADVVDLVSHDLIPFAVWRRPSVLHCYRCGHAAHDGHCRGEEVN